MSALEMPGAIYEISAITCRRFRNKSFSRVYAWAHFVAFARLR